MIDDSNFVRNRLLMLHPTRAVTLSREDFKAEAEQLIDKIQYQSLTWYYEDAFKQT